MATIRNAIELQDRMTPAFRSMTTAMNIVINTFERLEGVSGNAVNPRSLQAAREKLAEVEAAVQQVEESFEQAGKQQENFNRRLSQGQNAADGLGRKIKQMAAGYLSMQGLLKTINLSDQLASTTARLNLIVEDGGSVAALEAKIMASAERARSSYLDTASAISKMGANAGSAFRGNDELIAFMEQVNKQFVIGGASAEEQKYAMVQLTQAMGAGALRGEELNSILEQAPGIARAIEQYMGAAEGSIKRYAEQGLITSEVVKNALFAAADETNAKFESMPKTFAQIWNSIKNQALEAFAPILKRLNEIANSEKFQQVVQGLIQGIAAAAEVASWLFAILVEIGSFFVDHWSVIGPIVWGIVAGFVAWKAITLAQAAAAWLHTAAIAAQTTATAAQTAATGAATTAQTGLNLAMLACPLTWIIVGIAAVVAAILWLANVVGGFDVLWRYAWAGIQVAFYYAAGAITSGFWWMVYGLMWAGDKLITFWEEVKMAAYRIFNAIADFFGQVGASIMLGLEAIVNGAIWILNQFIGGINAISGIIGIKAINEIEEVDFGRKAQAQADAAAAMRAASYQQYAAGIAADRQARQNNLADMAHRAESAWSDNAEKAGKAWQDAVDYDNQKKAEQAMTAALQAGQAATGLFSNGTYGVTDSMAQNLSDINDNTKGISDSLEISSEDLKYMRDIAERDVINRFTTAEIKVEMTNHNTIEDNRDLDGMFDYMGEKLEETLLYTAEGVHV